MESEIKTIYDNYLKDVQEKKIFMMKKEEFSSKVKRVSETFLILKHFGKILFKLTKNQEIVTCRRKDK